MFSVLNEELQLSAPEPPPRTGSAEGIQRDIRLDGVTYTYAGAHVPAVKNLSINIQKAETVGFVGTSGAGKSTLVDVILGLLEPEAGSVVVDGHDIRENMRRWQDQIGYVPQSIYLTDDTLFRNVAFGLPDDQIDEGAVVRAIRAAQLQDFVAELPQGLQTVIGERGVRLSGGQRQRIGIARALYHDPAVLVLDEATSALDTVTERGVLSAVIALHGAKTVLIVAHRLSTVEHCDRIYRLDHGSVVAEGAASSMLPVQRVV
jgi:ABC-type multidrug transport system fused ATPase/permease subunit